MTVVLEEQGDKTTMTFRQSCFESAADRDGHGEGWSECFDRLERYLKEMQQAGSA